MPERGPERIAALGAAAIAVSIFFPWYGFKLGSPLSATALDSFNFAHFALVITAGCALGLATRWRRSDLPRPLTAGNLVVAAGAWCLLVIAFLIADPPDDLLDGTSAIGGVRLRYGIYVAAGGASAIVLGGLGMRAQDLRARKDGARP